MFQKESVIDNERLFWEREHIAFNYLIGKRVTALHKHVERWMNLHLET
jgi:hypothetical protein